MYKPFSQTGIEPVINISRATNGWIVEVHHANRERETSEETLARRKEEENKRIEAQKERERKRIIRDAKLQMANMAIISEAASKAQHRAVESAVESWKSDDDDEEEDEKKESLDSKIEEMAAEAVAEMPSQDYSFLGAALTQGSPSFMNTETHIFTDRAKMIEFVNSMLQPITE